MDAYEDELLAYEDEQATRFEDQNWCDVPALAGYHHTYYVCPEEMMAAAEAAPTSPAESEDGARRWGAHDVHERAHVLLPGAAYHPGI